MRINTSITRLALILAALPLASACTSMDHYRDKDPDPNHRLNKLMNTYDEATANGQACLELWQVDSATIDCSRVTREVERLYAEYPNNPRILLTNAVMNYEGGHPEKAQFLLDSLLAQYGSHPEAAILRSHIALEEGNSKMARELLERQIALAPDRADLREALAATYYVDGHYDTARVVLSIAGRLGTPGWRLSYHHGLLCEAELKWNEACRFYNTALEQKADYLPAQSRLIGLSQHKECRSEPALSSQLSPGPVKVAEVKSVTVLDPPLDLADDTPGDGVELWPYRNAGEGR